MNAKTVSGLLLTLLLSNIFTFAANFQPVEASGTIYIRADGSVDPPDAPISSVDNVTYTFTGNIYDEIVVERSDIIIDGDGCTLQGSYKGNGFAFWGVSNVTITRTHIERFYRGIWLSTSSNTILKNNITNNDYGVYLVSSNNTISENNIAHNYDDGVRLSWSSSNTISSNSIDGTVYLYDSFSNTISDNNVNGGITLDSSSSSNTISRNNITNGGRGIYLWLSSSFNTISSNNIMKCGYGVYFKGAHYNKFYHNNLIDNTQQAYITFDSYDNVWDDGYPNGGNYWSNHDGADSYNGPYQNETGSDGIGDISYVIDEYNRDDYPLVHPWGSTTGDLLSLVRDIKSMTLWERVEDSLVDLLEDAVYFLEHDYRFPAVITMYRFMFRVWVCRWFGLIATEQASHFMTRAMEIIYLIWSGNRIY